MNLGLDISGKASDSTALRSDLVETVRARPLEIASSGFQPRFSLSLGREVTAKKRFKVSKA